MPIPALLFMVGFVVLCVAALAHDPSWALFVYLGIYFLVPASQWWGYALPALPWMFIASVVCLAAFALRYKQYASTTLGEAPAFRTILWFSAVILAVTPLAVWEARHNLIIDKQWKMLVILFVMYKVIDSRRKLEMLLWTYLGGMYYISTIARSRGRVGGGRLEGLGTIDSTDANDLGSVFVAGIPLLVFYVMEGKNWFVRIAAAWCLAYGLNTIILLNSRGAFIGLVAAMGAYLFATCFMLKRSASYRFKIFAGVLAALGLLLYLADDTFWDRQSTLTSVSKADGTEEVSADSDGGRMAIWGAAIRVAGDHPLGLGGYGFTAVSPTVLPTELLAFGSTRSVHSTYLEALTAFGFLGFALFAAVIWRTFSHLAKAERQLRQAGRHYESLQACALAAGFIGYLVCSVFVTRLYAETTYYLPLFCTILASISLRELSAGGNPITPDTGKPADMRFRKVSSRRATTQPRTGTLP